MAHSELNIGAPEATYVQRVPIAHRKQYAQFFTPCGIAGVMNDWVCAGARLRTVLEPAFGLGVFSRDLLERQPDLHITAYDTDRTIADEARGYFGGKANVELRVGDYLASPWEDKYDGIVCNPPYFKFHDYDNKACLKSVGEHLAFHLTGFTNIYTLFMLKSLHQLSEGGRMAYIVPSEFLNSDYGVKVKDYLLRSGMLRHIIVFNFEDNIFGDAITTSCIVLCANDKGDGKVRMTYVRNADDFGSLRIAADSGHIGCNTLAYDIGQLDAGVKWRQYYKGTAKATYKHLVPFSTYAKVMRGIATGANDYFRFNRSKAERYKIDKKFLIPCICKSVDVPSLLFTKADFDKLEAKDKNVYLLHAQGADNKFVADYIKRGEEQGIDRLFLTSSRTPWYSLEKRKPAPILVSVFNRKGLRFVRNKAQVANLTNFHCVYVNTSLFGNMSPDLLFAYLATDTARAIFEDNCREYGNGLQKFEPNDLNKAMMLDLAMLPQHVKNEIEELVESKGNDLPIAYLDEILNNYFT